MPYLIRKSGDEWCVYKEDADGNPIGDSLGCHDSEEKAESQRRAIYANESDKAAQMRRYTYNGVTVMASGRRPSSRDDKKYERTILVDGDERIVHYGDPNLDMQRDDPERRANFLARHNCDAKSDPTQPGFWACLDWQRTDEKSVDDDPCDCLDADMLDAAEEADIVTEKRLMRPTQAEANYMPLSAVDGKACANCRWFSVDGGAYCHVIENHPADVLATGMCDRHESAVMEALPMMGERALDEEPFDDGFETVMVTVSADSPAGDIDDGFEPVADAAISETFVKELAEIDGTATATDTSAEAHPERGRKTLLYADGTMVTTGFGQVPVTDTPAILADPHETTIPTALADAMRENIPSGGEPVNATITVSPRKSSLKALRAAVDRLLGRDADTLATGLKVHGNHFVIIWSNNFEDRDGEIFTAKAIDDFVTRVDAGIVPPPDLWVWHTDVKTRIGKSAWVGRHGHFLLAAGEFDDTPAAQRAKAYYTRHAKKTAVSHGFSYPPDAFDGRHYHRFNTFEISLLPRGKEANRFTSLEGIKSMALSEEKRNYLKDVFGDAADGILSDLEKRGKALEELGVEYKDFTAIEDAATAPNADASDDAELGLKELVAEVIGDSAQIATYMAEQTKRFAEYKAAQEARETARDAEIAALKEQLDSRPRSATRDEATEITAERLSAIEAQAKKQLTVIDPFTGLEVETGAA